MLLVCAGQLVQNVRSCGAGNDGMAVRRESLPTDFLLYQSLGLMFALATVLVALPVVLEWAAPVLQQPLTRRRPSVNVDIDPGVDLLHRRYIEAHWWIDGRTGRPTETVLGQLAVWCVGGLLQQPMQPVVRQPGAMQPLLTFPKVAATRLLVGRRCSPPKGRHRFEPLRPIAQPLGDTAASRVAVKLG